MMTEHKGDFSYGLNGNVVAAMVTTITANENAIKTTLFP